MLFMMLYSFPPERRNEVAKRALELEKKGVQFFEGIKTIGHWMVPGGTRGFQVFEAQDCKTMERALLAWDDLYKIETVPILELEEIWKIAKSVIYGP